MGIVTTVAGKDFFFTYTHGEEEPIVLVGVLPSTNQSFDVVLEKGSSVRITGSRASFRKDVSYLMDVIHSARCGNPSINWRELGF